MEENEFLRLCSFVFRKIKRSKEIEILRKRLKKFLHTLEHSKCVSTRKRNDGFCPDALAV